MSANGERPGIGIGLVGCGHWGPNYLRAFSELGGCRLVAACDLNPDRVAHASRRYPGVRAVDSLEALLADKAITAVVVATQASLHFSVVRSVIESGRDCLVEKPMTLDVDEARHLRDLARARQRILMVGHVFQYNTAINLVRQLITSRAIGELEYLYFTRTNLGPIRSDVNVVWDLMAHDVSILLHFLHESPSWVSAQGASYLQPGCQDVAFATVGFDGGVIANIRASWLDPRKVREITVVGTRKMIFFNDLEASEPVRIFDKGAVRERTHESSEVFKLVPRIGEIVSPALPASEPLKNQCMQFLNCIHTRGQPLTDAEDGLRVVEVLSAIDRSVNTNGAPQSLAPALAAINSRR
jgi:predicted dehydrogenase